MTWLRRFSLRRTGILLAPGFRFAPAPEEVLAWESVVLLALPKRILDASGVASIGDTSSSPFIAWLAFHCQQFLGRAGPIRRAVPTYLLPNSGEDGGETSTSGYVY